jgi:hypothetical protein
MASLRITCLQPSLHLLQKLEALVENISRPRTALPMESIAHEAHLSHITVAVRAQMASSTYHLGSWGGGSRLVELVP